ncbi:hypothetical protein [Legionella drancourtii]|uniref:hypothetical protein n=1 Tax=Legionella drancourtii TaxID=168933 RepID=UPI0001B0263A|nr:hypothetical protein [Legionella drancourtii]
MIKKGKFAVLRWLSSGLRRRRFIKLFSIIDFLLSFIGCFGKKLGFGAFFFIYVAAAGATQTHEQITEQEASLLIQYVDGKSLTQCTNKLLNCLVSITQNPSCLPQPGSITITNNSKLIAKNINAFSANSNFLTYVVQDNGCPSALAPGASCILSFYTNTAVAFLVSNVAVKGSNTNATYFDMQAFVCSAPQAEISASPLSLTLGTVAPTNQGAITITNNASSPVNAEAITANLSGTGSALSVSYTNCSSVAPGATCTITFTANSLLAPSNIQISGSNTNVVVATVSVLSPTLSVQPTAAIPVNDPAGVSVTVTNLSSDPVYNVSADLSATGWNGVNSSTCAVIAANGGTCALNFTSSTVTPYVAQGGIVISGTNVSVPTTIALAFSMNGYLVFSVPNSTTAYVVADSDAAGSPAYWGADSSGNPDSTSIWGIADTSTSISPFPNATQPSGQTATQYAGQQNCDGLTDSSCNSGNIFIYYNSFIAGAPVPTSDYAEGLCYQITSDNSGSVAAGTWYLPSICEWGVYSSSTIGLDAGCGTSTENIQINLYSLGFVADLATNLNYWSSTEYSGAPMSAAWYQYFRPLAAPNQLPNVKSGQFGVRCIRAINY